LSDVPTVLVLGVGGNVSQGIIKALALIEPRPRVIGACISDHSAGLYMVDRAYISPIASDPAFPAWLEAVCEREGVDAVLSGVEPVLSVLAERSEALRERTGAVAIVSPSDRLMIGEDKLLTARWLADKGLNYARSVPVDDRDAVQKLLTEVGYPLIAKPRHGKGAQGVMNIHSEVDLAWALARPGYMLQELLGDPDDEYTVASFSDSEGRVRGTFTMRRELAEGTTVMAEAGAYPEVTAEARPIAESLHPVGPANFQLRVARGVPVCFDINVRFSGTAPIRARLGFNDVEASLRHYVLGEDATDLPVVTEGLALRYWNEIYVDPAAAAELKEGGRLEDPAKHPLVVEGYGRRA
jgi:carbamoyl-phosphate synthase large subunit